MILAWYVFWFTGPKVWLNSLFSRRVYLAHLRPRIQPISERKQSCGMKWKCSVSITFFYRITSWFSFQTAFTRTLTTLYSTTLLCLLTTLQLTLLARSKYVSSVLQLEREERLRECLKSELSFSSVLLNGGRGLESLMAGNISHILNGGESAAEADSISEEAESKYLTLSWWLLHVGWKDVGERVRRGVEEVFYGYVSSSCMVYIYLYCLFPAFLSRLN